MEKEQIEKLKQMLSSKDLDDINLAGAMIKEQLLKISDSDLKTFWQLIDTLCTNPHKSVSGLEMLRDLLQSDMHIIQPESPIFHGYSQTYNPSTYIDTAKLYTTTGIMPCTFPGDTTTDSSGTVTL